MYPEGKYEGEVTGHGITQTKAGDDQAFVELKGEHGKITAFLPLSGDSLKYTAKKLRACGARRITDVDDGVSLVGAKVSFTVDHRERDGKVYANVGWINPPGALKRTQISEASKRRLQAAFDALDDTPSKQDDGDEPF